MNINDYRDIIEINNYEEYPFFITGHEKSLKSFIEFNKIDIDLKIYLAKHILCRCFSTTGGIYWPDNPKWFIKESIKIFESDFNKPWLTSTIKESIEMILRDDDFSKGIIGTTFLFGVIEFYAKQQLGLTPTEFDFFDKEKQDSFRKLSIGSAINRLKKTNSQLSISLNEIDNHNIKRLKDAGIQEGRFTLAKISDRLTLSRNTMLHGENHSFYDKGLYLAMLYFLFYFHDLKNSFSKDKL